MFEQSAKIRDSFLGWQCRLRQIAVREEEGRPSQGMCAGVYLRGGRQLMDAMTILIMPRHLDEHIDFFRFQVKKNNDPKEVYEKGLLYLQSTFYNRASSFSDNLTSVFPSDSAVAAALVEEGECLLTFGQYSQSYQIICTVSVLDIDEHLWQASFWHNRLFNANLTEAAQILLFQPKWESARTEPPVG